MRDPRKRKQLFADANTPFVIHLELLGILSDDLHSAIHRRINYRPYAACPLSTVENSPERHKSA